MANERDLDRLLREKLSQVQRLAERKLISGYRNNAGDIVLRDSASPQGTFYARTVQDSRDKVVIYGDCSVVNVPFVAEYDGNGNLVYKYQDTEIADLQTQGTASTIFAPPAIPNLSQINVGDYQFAPLRVNFDTSGGLSVAVGAGWHVGDLFEGGTIDLTSNVPATPGEVRWVVVGIDTTTNALTAINGTPITGTQQDLVIADIADIAIPTGVMPLGAVALANGQTAITQGTSWIVDIRRHHDLGGAGYYEIIEDNGTPETQRAALNFADNATGAIDFTATDDGANDRTTITATLDIEGLAEDSTPATTAFVVISDGGVLAKTSLADLSSTGNISVTDGTTTVDPTTDIDFDGAFFTVTDGGSGVAQVTFVTPPSGSKTRWIGRKIYDNTLSVAGGWDVQESDLVTGSGAYADYDVLVLYLMNGRGTIAATADSAYLYYNNDTTLTNYSSEFVTGNNATASAARADNPGILAVPAANSPTNYIGASTVQIYDPGSSKQKVAVSNNPFRRNATTHDSRQYAHHWENTAVITRIALKIDNDPTDQFAAGSRLMIVGYKNDALGSVVEYSAANVSNPPTDAELDTTFGSPADLPAGFVGIVNDNGAGTNEYLCWTDGTNWFYVTGTLAV